MQFNIPGPSHECLNARLPPRATLCHPLAHALTRSLPGSVSCPATVLTPCTHPGRTGSGRDGPPQVPGQGGGCRAAGMLLAQAVGRAHPCPSWVSGYRGVAAVSPDGECQADWHCQPCASRPGYAGPGIPLPYLPAGGDEVRLAGGTGLLHLHNNLVNGAWPAGEPGWRHHPLPAPPPPSGPAAPPAAARGAERSAGRAAGRVVRGRPAPGSLLTTPERGGEHPQGLPSIPDSVPEHPGSIPGASSKYLGEQTTSDPRAPAHFPGSRTKIIPTASLEYLGEHPASSPGSSPRACRRALRDYPPNIPGIIPGNTSRAPLEQPSSMPPSTKGIIPAGVSLAPPEHFPTIPASTFPNILGRQHPPSIAGSIPRASWAAPWPPTLCRARCRPR